MTAVVFAGPSIAPDRAPEGTLWDWRPPVAQGDVYRAAGRRPRAILIVDGFFDGVPAVWHKEILWAMSQGIHVFGAASMGALRAAELADFGMIGVGSIYRDFRAGRLTDDDEVAVLHAPAELGWTPLSEAMVNVRATLSRAVADAVLSPAAAEAMCTAAKRMFYQERDWEAVLAAAPVGGAAREALRDWLPRGRMDQKQADAAAALAEVAHFLAGDPPPLEVDWTLERTDLWEAVVSAGSLSTEDELVLDEARLDPDRFDRLRRAALLRLLAAGEGDATPTARRRAETLFRAARGLYDTAARQQWIRAAALDAAGFNALMREEAQVLGALEYAGAALDPLMISEMRADGSYPELRARAVAKRRAVGSLPTPALYPLAQWFFEQHLGREVPSDLATFARGLGLAGPDALARILAHELAYRRARTRDAVQPAQERPPGGRSAT